MTAPVTRIHPHICPYTLFVDGVWRSVSSCCWGLPLPLDPPGRKGRAA